MPEDCAETIERAYECANCLSETSEFGDCGVCGAAPHEGNGYRIECKDCGAIGYGDRGGDVQWDKRYHRMHHCPDPDFEVTAL